MLTPPISPITIFEKLPQDVRRVPTIKNKNIFPLPIFSSNIDCNFIKRKDANLLPLIRKITFFNLNKTAMKVRRQQIDDFFKEKQIAIAGVSRNPKKFGSEIFRTLTDKGYKVLPINPHAEEIEGVKCYANITSLPDQIESLLIVTPKHQTDDLLRQGINKGIKNIWVQQMSNTDETLKIAEEYDKEIIFGKCVFMFAEPTAGVHKFHRTLVKIFGALPK